MERCRARVSYQADKDELRSRKQEALTRDNQGASKAPGNSACTGQCRAGWGGGGGLDNPRDPQGQASSC